MIDALHRLRPGAVRPGGTDLGAGLDKAIEAIGTEEHAQGQAILVFSDGEDLADQWRSRLDRLHQKEVIVHAVTIGDAEHDHPVPPETTISRSCIAASRSSPAGPIPHWRPSPRRRVEWSSAWD